jgi:hypothetical protein
MRTVSTLTASGANMWRGVEYLGRASAAAGYSGKGFAKTVMGLAITAPLLAGCMIGGGPDRPITIEQDVAFIGPLAEPDLAGFLSLPLSRQASVRNQVITARMYIIDMEYSKYESNLTQAIEDEGLAATLVSMGLTTSASLIAVQSTSHILSGTATVVTGADKAISEKLLLNNTIQALQTQMRTDRKEAAAEITAKMLSSSIDVYPLPMALSDVEHYRQVGTIASALIGLSRTLANADQLADKAKTLAGPASTQVAAVKAVARPAIATPTVRVLPSSPQRVPAVRTSQTFVDDDAAAAALRKFLRPTGGPVDQDHLAQINAFLSDPAQRFQPIPQVPTFLNGSGFAAKRQELARKLGLIQ